jgi:glycosyltransferase involved in cell wall biosynthesis
VPDVARRRSQQGPPPSPLRVCLVYDCLYPYTVGGAERWYRSLAAELINAGDALTYVTRKQWPDTDPPTIAGLDVVAVSRPDPLYTPDGRRSIGPPLRFGIGVLGYFLRHRRSYDVVHTCSFPYFSVLALRLALLGSGTRIGVDWFEYWSDAYWRGYLGGIKGRVGAIVQRWCARATPLAFVASRRHGDRLRAAGVGGEVVALGGLYAGRPNPGSPSPIRPDPPTVLFAGRLIAEKRADLIGPVMAIVRTVVPTAQALILGDGPARPDVEQAIRLAGVAEAVRLAGFVPEREVELAMAAAVCLLLPTVREGYGLVVIEAAAVGTPSVVVEGPDNAAVELVEPGINGQRAARDDPAEIAAAVIAVIEGGETLRRTTLSWFADHEAELRVETATRRVMATYAESR